MQHERLFLRPALEWQPSSHSGPIEQRVEGGNSGSGCRGDSTRADTGRDWVPLTLKLQEAMARDCLLTEMEPEATNIASASYMKGEYFVLSIVNK